MRKLAEAQGQVQQILVQIAETKSSQGGSPGPADRLLSCLKQKLRKSSEQVCQHACMSPNNNPERGCDQHMNHEFRGMSACMHEPEIMTPPRSS
jgi:hypothetical protein